MEIGAALVFIFLAYGGWSDAATLSAEMRDQEHGMRRALVLGMSLVTVLYLFVNWAFLSGLTPIGLATSTAPAADLLLRVFGRSGQILIVLIVAVTSITLMNAILIAGARTTYAAARDAGASLKHLSGWNAARGTPPAAIIAIAGVALVLVAFGTYTRGGFSTMVDYLSPVYWLFLTLSGFAMIVLRRRYPDVRRPFPSAVLSVAADRFHRDQRLCALLERRVRESRRDGRSRGAVARRRLAAGLALVGIAPRARSPLGGALATVARVLKLDLIQTLAFAGVVLFIGYGLRKLIPPLARYNLPAPVLGGLLIAVLALIARERWRDAARSST